MLNCIAEFTGSDSNKSRCGNGVQRTITSTCQRLTADLYAGIINNYYMKPSHKKPYYYIINRNEKDQPVTNPVMDNEIKVWLFDIQNSIYEIRSYFDEDLDFPL